jgi:cobalamin biosynthesis Mg chelatase CobN
MTDVRFFFDPVCPWTWITSRWLVEVAEQWAFSITWEIFSLRHHNRDNPDYDGCATKWTRSTQRYESSRQSDRATTTRSGASTRRSGRSSTTTPTTTSFASKSASRRSVSIPTSSTRRTGARGTGRSWTAPKPARSLVGDDAGIPLIVIPDNPPILSGPVLSPGPTAALELWDAFVALGRESRDQRRGQLRMKSSSVR